MKDIPPESTSWHAILCLKGTEAAVRNDVLDRLTLHRLESRIEEVFIPSEAITTIRGGRKSRRERGLGFFLAKGLLDEPTARCIRETPGVQDFLPTNEQGNLFLREVSGEKPQLRIEFRRG